MTLFFNQPSTSKMNGGVGVTVGMLRLINLMVNVAKNATLTKINSVFTVFQSGLTAKARLQLLITPSSGTK